MYLIFDTETSGFPNPKVLNTSAAQARVVQIAAVLYNERWEEVRKLYTILKPPFENFKVHEGAFECHGISVEDMISKGRDQSDVLKEFFEMVSFADYVIAHNFDFDDMMLRIEIDNLKNESLKVDYHAAWKFVNYFCTMELTTDLCKLPFASRRTFGKKYKWPKLQEACMKLMGCPIIGAHDSLNDCLATGKLFRYLVEHNHVNLSLPVLSEE